MFQVRPEERKMVKSEKGMGTRCYREETAIDRGLELQAWKKITQDRNQ